MSNRKEIIKQAGRYAFSAQIAQVATLFTAIIARRFLGPAQAGIWSTLQVINEYAKYSSFGTFYSVAREIPYLMGKGDKEKANKIKNNQKQIITFDFIKPPVLNL